MTIDASGLSDGQTRSINELKIRKGEGGLTDHDISTLGINQP